LLVADAIATGAAGENRCPLPPAPSAAAAASASTAVLLGDVQHISQTKKYLEHLCCQFLVYFFFSSLAASAFVTVACPCRCAFPNLLVIVAMCATSPASCMSSTTTGSGDATPAPNTPIDNNDEDDEDYH
jgi:hypothetical protein